MVNICQKDKSSHMTIQYAIIIIIIIIFLFRGSKNLVLILEYLRLHYENSPIQIYRKFHLQKLKIFRWKTLIFFIFLLKT